MLNLKLFFLFGKINIPDVYPTIWVCCESSKDSDVNPTKEPVMNPTSEPDVNPTKGPDVNPTV